MNYTNTKIDVHKRVKSSDVDGNDINNINNDLNFNERGDGMTDHEDLTVVVVVDDCGENENDCEDVYSALSLMTQETGYDLDAQPFALTFKTTLIFINGTIASLLFGYDTAIVAGILVSIKPEDLNRTLLTNWDKELITGITCVGCIIGSSINFADKYGRKFVLQGCLVIFMVSSLIMVSSKSLAVLVWGRFLVGTSIGGFSTTCPLYLSEIAPTHIRNNIMTFHTIAITGGQVIAYLVSLAFSTLSEYKYNDGSNSSNGFLKFVTGVSPWRLSLVLPLIPAILMLITMPIVPESPRYLIYKGNFNEAQTALSLIYPLATREQINQKIYKTVRDIIKIASINQSNDNNGETLPLLQNANRIINAVSFTATPITSNNPSTTTLSVNLNTNAGTRKKQRMDSFLRRPSEVKLHEYLQSVIQKSLQETQKLDSTSSTNNNMVDKLIYQKYLKFIPNWFANFRHMGSKTKRALWVGCTLMFLQQIVGFNSFMNYSPLIFQPYTNNPLIPGFLVSLTNFVGTLFSLKFINKIGSRKTLLYSIPFMTLGLTLCLIAFKEHVNKNNSQMLVISMLIYVFSYAAAMGNVPNMSVTFLPLNKRSFGQSCILMVNWSTNFLVTSTYLTLVELFGNECIMGFYVFMTIAAWYFVYYYFPEVKGLSLEEIGLVFSHGINVNYVYDMYHS